MTRLCFFEITMSKWLMLSVLAESLKEVEYTHIRDYCID